MAQPAISQSLGVKVDANTALLVTSDQQTNSDGTITVSLNIANVGDTAVRSVYAKASSRNARFVGANDKFVGTLNLDDSTTLALTVAAPRQNATQAPPVINVAVSYKDPINQEHVVNQEISLGGSNGGSNGFPASAAQNTRFGRGQQGLYFGFSLIQWGAAALCLVVAFFGYRWYNKRKKASVSAENKTSFLPAKNLGKK